MHTLAIISLTIVVITFVMSKIFKKKYLYYIIEVWGEIPEAGTSEMGHFPEEEKGPNLRQSIKTKKWEIGREAYSFFGHYYLWQPIGEELANELLRKITAGEHVQVLLKDNNEAIIAK